MDTIAQKHPMACGMACVAFLAGVSYDEIAQDKPSFKLNRIGFLCPELVTELKKYGLNYGWKKLDESDRDGEFNIGDIVYIEPSPSHRGGHFLAKSTKGWMDPWINLDPNRPYASEATSGFREKLPGRAEYLVYRIS